MELIIFATLPVIAVVMTMLYASELVTNRQLRDERDFYLQMAEANREKCLSIQRFYESRKEYDVEVEDE